MFTLLHSSSCRARTPMLVALLACVSLSPVAQAQEVLARGAESYGPVTPVASPRADSTPAPRTWQPGDPVREVPRRVYLDGTVTNQAYGEGWRDPLQDLVPGIHRAPTISLDVNVAGSGNSGVMPPDTVGDVGPNHFIQAINASNSSTIRIMDKSGATLTTFALSSLASGGRCSNDGSGDPIVLYDQLADRWFLQEFTGGNDLCIYISQTPDPTGAYFFYQFTPPVFPDYPHFGVWPDAYYGATNESGSGVTTYAFDRDRMLAGQPATMQRLKVVPKLPGYGFQTLTPVDHDGVTPPPLGASGLFMRHFDDEAHGAAVPATDLLQMYSLNVDWTTPANTTVTTLPSITITDFNSWLINYTTFAAVPQPSSGQRIDPIREAIMNRLAYRNFGTHESIVGNFVTNRSAATSGSTVQAGIRWFELRRSGGMGNPWTLQQEGTYAGDTNSTTANFWLGGIAQDSSGNIALGYSKTDTGIPAVFPSIGVTGHLASDAAGTMGAETLVIAGGGSQGGGDRWGDYAAMGIDPADDCTFWYTNEHIPSSSWATRVVAFHFDECFSGFTLTPTPETAQVCALDDTQVPFSIEVAGRNEWSGIVELSVSGGLPAGASAAFSPNNQAVDFSSVLTVGNLGAVASGSYELQILGTDGIDEEAETSVLLDLSAALPGTLALVGPVNGATDVSALPSLSWGASSDAIDHQVQIATDPGFTDIVYQADVVGTSHEVADLLSGDTQYYWRVIARNLCGTTASDVGSFRTGLMFCAAPGAALTNVNCVSPGTGTSSVIDIPTSGNVTDVDIAVLVTHSHVGDLQVRLSRGEINNRQLVNRISNGGGGCSADDINATLDDEAGNPVQTACPPDGTYLPANALDVFDGTELSGPWTLNVRDCAAGDNGVFESWCVLPTLADSDANTPPTFEGDPYSFQVGEQASVGTLVGVTVASDVDSGQTLSYGIAGGNTGNAFAIDASGAIRVATPAAVTAGNAPFVLQLTVSDGVSGVDSTTATVAVIPNVAPVLTAAATADYAENGTGVVLTASATDTEDDPANLTFGLTGPDAALFQFEPASGELSFLTPPDFENPLDAGGDNVHDVTLTVTDTGGASDTQAIAIAVTDVNEAPAFTSTPVTAAAQDAAYTAPVTATDPDAGASLTLAAPTLPTWLSFTDNGDGTGTLSGTPDDGDAGTHDVVLTVTDGVIATPVEQAFAITVTNVNEAPVPGTVADVSVQFGSVVSIDAGVAFTDPDGDDLTFALSSTPGLPASLGIDEDTGVISGTPLEADIGSYEITVTATDPDGEEASLTFTLSVVGEHIFGDGFESPN